eukprot:scaffold10507_cov194-Skeletonema_dohrnii-CCMP3373.AAC.3
MQTSSRHIQLQLRNLLPKRKTPRKVPCHEVDVDGEGEDDKKVEEMKRRRSTMFRVSSSCVTSQRLEHCKH